MPNAATPPLPANRPAEHAPRVAVVGAGVTGLAAALRLLELMPRCSLRVLEAADRPGGVLQTVRRDGFLIERSADSFLARTPWAVDFCRDVGVADELAETDPTRRRALVVHQGRLAPAPEGFQLMAPRRLAPVLTSPLLDWRGKLRLLAEPLAPRRHADGDESVAAFARRRVGRQALERLVQPLLGGIYTADPNHLSMAATMPQFVAQERRYGSLLRAAWAERSARQPPRESGARYGQFLAPRLGMQQVVDAAAARLPPGVLRLATPVEEVRRQAAAWRLVSRGAAPAEASFDAVIITTPTHQAAAMVRPEARLLADALQSIPYAGCSVVCLGVQRDQVASDLPGFGFVVPAVERREIIAASFASLKFSGRTPAGGLLVRVFVGGAMQPRLGELPDAHLTALAIRELRQLVGLSGTPRVVEIARWPRGMPQYHVGHLDRVAEIERLAAELPGLELAGAGYRGVGIPQCVRDGRSAAERLAEHLAARTPS